MNANFKYLLLKSKRKKKGVGVGAKGAMAALLVSIGSVPNRRSLELHQTDV
jgi:hypothetical protein